MKKLAAAALTGGLSLAPLVAHAGGDPTTNAGFSLACRAQSGYVLGGACYHPNHNISFCVDVLVLSGYPYVKSDGLVCQAVSNGYRWG